jgi:hypothetical protein
MSLSLLIVVVKSSGLTPTDYLALVLMIDTQCSALSATLSSKDALASRWYVGLTLSGQAFAWGVILYANYKLPATLLLSAEKHQCLTESWLVFAVTPWRTFDGSMVNLGFRVYWYLHAADFIHAGWLAVRHTKQFDALEKIDRRKHIDLAGTLANSYDTGFSRLRGTVFSNWYAFAAYPVLLTLTLEKHMRGIETSVWGDWGQMMPLMTLVFGVSHWFYVNGGQLRDYARDQTSTSDSGNCVNVLWTQCRESMRDLGNSASHLDRGEILPYDIMRRIAMGATPSEIGEENYKLLTAKKLD